jgi:hypothetical protein
MNRRLTTYRFNIGDSYTGGAELVLVIRAETKGEAFRRAADLVCSSYAPHPVELPGLEGGESLHLLTNPAYFGEPEVVTTEQKEISA